MVTLKVPLLLKQIDIGAESVQMVPQVPCEDCTGYFSLCVLLCLYIMKKQFTCPMHPEVISDKPGRCPKCGMKLVSKDEVTTHTMSENDHGLGKLTWKSYLPLFVI